MATENLILTQHNQEMRRKKGYWFVPDSSRPRSKVLAATPAIGVTADHNVACIYTSLLRHPLLAATLGGTVAGGVGELVACTSEHNGSWCMTAAIALLHLLTVWYTCGFASYK
jgi:lysozyme family protein